MISELPIVDLGVLLLVASVVAVATRRMRLPYSVGLVVAGMVLSFLSIAIDLSLTPDLIFTVLLPPLIFEAAIQIRWAPFRRELPVILTLAFAGVVIAAAIMAVGMHVVFGWGWLGAAMFGVLISATDPIAVIAAFKEMKVEGRLSLLVEGESLLNDGAAVVGFAVLVAIAAGATAEPTAIAALLLWAVLGGVIVGGVVAGALLLLAGRTEDHLVEIALTVIAAYGSFLIAEHFHASGVLASLTAGMVVGNIGSRRSISLTGRENVLSFWEFAAFLANSTVFIPIGVHTAHQAIAMFAQAAALAIVLVLLGRAAAVYLLSAIFSRSHLAVDLRYQHVLWWGGLRGAIALALALSLPDNLPERGQIVAIAFAVVAFSIFVQGLTMAPLMRRLGLMQREEAAAKQQTHV
jgi:CPA1 family monovalent cation:H+ antiporter